MNIMMSNLNKEKKMNEQVIQMRKDLHKAVLECFWVPNEVEMEHPEDVDVFGPSRLVIVDVLPSEFKDEREGGRTLARLDSMCKDRDVPAMSQHEIDKAEKAKRANSYRAQLETGDTFDYEEDEDRLYRNQMAFVGAMVNSGVLDADDFDED